MKILPNKAKDYSLYDVQICQPHDELWGIEGWLEFVEPVTENINFGRYNLIVVIAEGSPGKNLFPVPGMADRLDLAAYIYHNQINLNLNALQENEEKPTVILTSGISVSEDGNTPHAEAAMNYLAEINGIPADDTIKALFSSDTIGEIYTALYLCIHPNDQTVLHPTPHQQINTKPHMGDHAYKNLEHIRKSGRANILFIVPDYHAARVTAMAQKLFGLDFISDGFFPMQFHVDVLPVENPYLPAAAKQEIMALEASKIIRDQDSLKHIHRLSDFRKWLFTEHGWYRDQDNLLVARRNPSEQKPPIVSYPEIVEPAIRKYTNPRVKRVAQMP